MSNTFAVIENNKVVNVVVADENYAISQGWVALSTNVGIGWNYDGTTFIDNRPVFEITSATQTKEELLAQLQELQEQIQTL